MPDKLSVDKTTDTGRDLYPVLGVGTSVTVVSYPCDRFALFGKLSP